MGDPIDYLMSTMYSIFRSSFRLYLSKLAKQSNGRSRFLGSLPKGRKISHISYQDRYFCKICLQKPTKFKETYYKIESRFLQTTVVNHDYYKTLGVSRTATKSDIKVAYFQLAKKYHPDANPGDVNAKQKFQEIAEAYTVLSDDSQRQQYDSYGVSNDEGFQQYQQGQSYGYSAPQNVNPEEVFKKMFEELGLQETIKNLENAKEEATFAIEAAGKGDWAPAKAFASNHKGLILGVVAPVLILIRFPWIIVLLMQFGLRILGVLARDPRLAAIIGKALYEMFKKRANKSR